MEQLNYCIALSGTWIGGASGSETDWNTASNWVDGLIPNSSLNAVIPGSASYFPVISGTANSKNLMILDNATVSVVSGGTINIFENMFVGEGGPTNFSMSGGTCNVTGSMVTKPNSVVNITGGILNE